MKMSELITYLLQAAAQPCPLRDLLSCTTRMRTNIAYYHSASSEGMAQQGQYHNPLAFLH